MELRSANAAGWVGRNPACIPQETVEDSHCGKSTGYAASTQLRVDESGEERPNVLPSCAYRRMAASFEKCKEALQISRISENCVFRRPSLNSEIDNKFPNSNVCWLRRNGSACYREITHVCPPFQHSLCEMFSLRFSLSAFCGC